MIDKKKYKLLPLIVALLGGSIVIMDFTTGIIGFTGTIRADFKNLLSTPRIKVSNNSNSLGLDCLTFSFTEMPSDFTLDYILLDILEAKGPTRIPGDQAAHILSVAVNSVIDERTFVSMEAIKFNVRIESNKSNDNFYVDYCPKLRRKGYKGFLKVKPIFFQQGVDLPLNNIKLVTPSNDLTISFTVSHPNNYNFLLDKKSYHLSGD